MGSRCRAVMVVAALVLFAAPGTAAALPPDWEADVGTPIAALSNTDDNATTIDLGTFSFPFYGTTYTGAGGLTISSNGFVMPGSPGGGVADDNNPTGAKMASLGPRISPYWSDLITADNVPDDQGAVLLNTFDDDADPAIDRLVVTWQVNTFGCLGQPAYPACANDFQLQLLETGEIIFGYDRLFPADDQAALAGVSAGNVPAVDAPASTDFSGTGYPIAFGAVAYQLFTSQPLQTGLVGRNLVFTPVSTTGFTVDQLGADVAVSLTATAAVNVGGRVSYQATVRNTGDAPATDVTLVDRLPFGVALASAPGCTGTATLTCPIGTLAPGESKTIGFELTATAPGTLVNTVTVRSAESGDPEVDNSASAATTVAPLPVPIGPAPPAAVDVRASRVRQNIAGVARTRGIRLRIRCSEECSAEARARVSRSTARRLGRRNRTLGLAFGGRDRAGSTTIEIPLSRRLARRVSGLRSLRVTLTTTIATAEGERVVTLTQTIQR
jgi:uncharacterized repeat protein (TIGR01451 family)